MILKFRRLSTAAAVAGLLALGATGAQAVTPQEAEQLKTTLTPLGGERAGNADGSIPAWEGGYTTPIPGFVNGGKRPDPFADDKPLYSITAANVAQHADKLSDGVKAMFEKYPDTYRIDVYPTRRTAAAPQWVYDNTFKNATNAKLVEGGAGLMPEGAYGGIPFPIPKNGAEVMWNHLLHWRGEAWHFDIHGVLGTASGRHVLTVDGRGDQQMPYYFKDGSLDTFNGEYWMIRLINAGPPIRAGEAITGRNHLDDDKSQAWVYLTGQRRVRKLPSACCDTPTPATAGVMSFDELEVFTGRIDRYNWTLVGKKEMIIPYNSNRTLVPTKDSDVLGAHHLNPDHVRWELHRVWVVDAELAPGKRHLAPKARYYIDEDSWAGVLADRWDSKGQLWKTMFQLPIVMPDLPATTGLTFGFNDLMSGAWYVNLLFNEKAEQYKIMPPYDDTVFTPAAMAGEGIR